MSKQEHAGFRFTFGYLNRGMIAGALFILPMIGCQLNAESDIQPLNSSNELRYPERSVLRVYFPPIPRAHPLSVLDYALEITERETGRVILREWVAPTLLSAEELAERDSPALSGVSLPEGGALTFQTPALSHGVYQLSLFVERQASQAEGGAPRLSRCQTPPDLSATLSLDRVDPFVAQWEGKLQADQELWLDLKRVSCAPGDLNTQLSGVSVISPERLAITYVSLSYLDDEGSLPPLIFPLREFITDGAPADRSPELAEPIIPSGAWRYPFKIPQVRPGRAHIQLFTDDDHDFSLSPCSRLTMTGADRATSDRREVNIERGSALQVEEPLLLSEVSSCEGVGVGREVGEGVELVALTGRLEVSDALQQALQGARGQKALWYQLATRRPQPLTDLYQLSRGQGRFTLLLPPSELDEPSPLRLWVDQGEDGRFEPCSEEAEAYGVDVRWWSGTTAPLRPLLEGSTGEGSTGEPITLISRCDAPEALVTGQVELELTVDEGWGPRPLIIEREDLFTGLRVAQRIGVFTREELSSLSLNFEQRVSAGSYGYRAYLDQESAPGFQPCEPGRLGEIFSTSSEELVSVSRGSISDSMILRLTQLPCATPSATLLITPQAPVAERAVDGLCRAQELLTSVKSGGELLISSRCVPLSARGELSVEGLYGGPHQVTLCQEISPSPVIGLPCEQAQALTADVTIIMKQSPTQAEAIPLEYACACDEPAPQLRAPDERDEP